VSAMFFINKLNNLGNSIVVNVYLFVYAFFQIDHRCKHYNNFYKSFITCRLKLFNFGVIIYMYHYFC